MKTTTFIFGLALCHTGLAQQKPALPIPIEIIAGPSQMQYVSIVDRSLPGTDRFGFFGFTTYTYDHRSEVPATEFLTNLSLTYDVSRSFKLATGISLNSVAGRSYFAGVQYSFANENWLVVVVPAIFASKTLALESLSFVEFKPKISNQLRLYTRLQTLYNYEATMLSHNRSYLNARLGLSHGKMTFGLGRNADFYGPAKYRGVSYGLFLRANL